ncbi:hypothetical protein [Brevibacterium aurantiacum]|uniref:Uncharacterized protein n=1 Tax=Brevibacterium aurantiacum TaxID=273384 RepID=A0A556C5C8_BREAU|nr:hypothetical protein [Brevibacterium aurantiacum]TSI12664.1 hypothetical protein FO013_19515 [Brevibacterium aurantiacum]
MNVVAFDCGGCIPISEGQTVQSVITDHLTWCNQCPDECTEHEKHLDELHQRTLESRVNGALTEARVHP